MMQKWLGHAQLSTTAIYAHAGGAEEQTIAARMWGNLDDHCGALGSFYYERLAD